MRRLFLSLACILAVTPRCFAPPPLVTGDVPTADKGRCEWYAGARYQESESGKPARLLPFTELVFGISDRQELTFETAGLSKDGHYGLSDSVLGTKYVLLKHKLLANLTVHAAIGKSVREGNRGGPDLRVYAGLKWEFDAPWKRR